MHLVMDLCAGGELFDAIQEAGTYSEGAAAAMVRTIVEVVAHCHQLGVMHRDLKPENFLLSERGPGARLVCCDFGQATFFAPGQAFSERLGSPYYIAPEVLDGRYGPEADIWFEAAAVRDVFR